MIIGYTEVKVNRVIAESNPFYGRITSTKTYREETQMDKWVNVPDVKGGCHVILKDKTSVGNTYDIRINKFGFTNNEDVYADIQVDESVIRVYCHLDGRFIKAEKWLDYGEFMEDLSPDFVWETNDENVLLKETFLS